MHTHANAHASMRNVIIHMCTTCIHALQTKGQGLNLIEVPSALKKTTPRKESPYALPEKE